MCCVVEETKESTDTEKLEQKGFLCHETLHCNSVMCSERCVQSLCWWLLSCKNWSEKKVNFDIITFIFCAAEIFTEAGRLTS